MPTHSKKTIPVKPQETHDFLVRNIPRTLWDRFRAKAHEDGRSYRAAVVELMRDYVK
ncbi:MAG: hypothetical protein NUW22_05150 [Acidobacteria bacterium]|nr:hypothetical protein [Acidobacteriota bacterium]